MPIETLPAEPHRVAADTFLIHNHEGEGEAPVSVPLNTVSYSVLGVNRLVPILSTTHT